MKNSREVLSTKNSSVLLLGFGVLQMKASNFTYYAYVPQLRDLSQAQTITGQHSYRNALFLDCQLHQGPLFI